MKVVVINGSYHQNGVISILVDKLICGLKCSKSSIEIKEYYLLDIPIEFCKGCGCCTKNDGKKIGDCPQADSLKLNEILHSMLECDILVYASPVYEKAFTAVMKRFMERSMPILYLGKSGPVPRNGINNRKMGIVLVSCATPLPASIILGITKYPVHILNMFCKAFGCMKIKKIIVAGAYSKEQLNEKYVKKVHNMAVKLGENFDS